MIQLLFTLTHAPHFFCGHHQVYANLRNNQFDKVMEPCQTIVSVLQLKGYSVAAFGKWEFNIYGRMMPIGLLLVPESDR